jgi:peptidoglycan/xylan/chitin deacetylase (PgdA/CDA1 family)
MRLLSPVLHRMVYPLLGAAGYFHARSLPVVSVITYHGILQAGYHSTDAFLDNTLVTADVFRSHLKLLKKHYNVISPSEFLLWLRQGQTLPKRAMLLTCDDGLLNHLEVMLSILQEEEMECLFFVTGSSLTDHPQMLWYVELYLMLMEAREQPQQLVLPGAVIPEISADRGQRRSVWLRLLKTLSQLDSVNRRQFMDEARAKLGLPPSWTNRYLDDPLLRQRFQMLRPAELKQLAGAGMTIGAHSLSHPALSEQSPELARAEISGCREALEQFLGRPVWALAYPFGDPASVGAREYRMAEEAGYDCAFVNVGGHLDAISARYALPRIHITAEMSHSVYEAYVSGFHDALRDRLRPRTKNYVTGR